ncbi:MAG: HD domain-containing protein [Myxococcales bacterium]
MAACKVWFPEAFGPGRDLPESAQLQHAFAGLVMLADWIASDAELFPFASSLSDRMTFARQQARHVVVRLGLDVPVPQRLDPVGRDAFARISSFPPRAAQRAVTALPEAVAGSIVVLEAETGSGKTEAALAHFVRLFCSGQVDGLYFALPTRTAATRDLRARPGCHPAGVCRPASGRTCRPRLPSGR